VKNKEQYELFENMHWLCFHLEFEHGLYDVDEPCDDPSCPWNRISNYDIDIINTVNDAMLSSQSLNSRIYFNVEEVQLEYLLSKRVRIDFVDDYLKVQIDTWFEDNTICSFKENLVMLLNGQDCICSLESMSPSEFNLEINRLNSRGYFLVKLNITKNVYNSNFKSANSYSTQFEVVFNDLEKFVKCVASKLL
jgi:hypothetical protein